MAPDDSPPEVMLAQEQAVIRRGAGIRKGIEAAFGMGGETQGTLVLTDRRLVYVRGNMKEEGLEVGAFSAKRLFFSDVESLDLMSLESANLEVPISKITEVAGHRGEAIAPKLEVKWTDEKGVAQTMEFVQQITGGSRRKNLDDWAKVIERLKAGELKLTHLGPEPSVDTLEGQILAALGDMQEKGLLTIEGEVEGRYKVDLDPDEVEAACQRLIAAGLVRKTAPKDEDPYYRKASPLGEDLSA